MNFRSLDDKVNQARKYRQMLKIRDAELTDKVAMTKKKDTLSLRSFERLVKKALESLPDEFHRYLENVVVVIGEEPPDDMPDLLGLYEGGSSYRTLIGRDKLARSYNAI